MRLRMVGDHCDWLMLYKNSHRKLQCHLVGILFRYSNYLRILILVQILTSLIHLLQNYLSLCERLYKSKCLHHILQCHLLYILCLFPKFVCIQYLCGSVAILLGLLLIHLLNQQKIYGLEYKHKFVHRILLNHLIYILCLLASCFSSQSLH